MLFTLSIYLLGSNMFTAFYLCLFSPLKDWDYLLASNYHRQMNSQPTYGPVDASCFNNTDTYGLSSVSDSF